MSNTYWSFFLSLFLTSLFHSLRRIFFLFFSFTFFYSPFNLPTSQFYVFSTRACSKFLRLAHLVFIFCDFSSYLLNCLESCKLNGKFADSCQIIITYGYSSVVFCLFSLTSLTRSFSLAVGFLLLSQSFSPPAISYFSFVYCIINFIINFDFFFFFFSISYGFSC